MAKDNKYLIILEMANNHSGSVDHAKTIIRAYSEICKPYIDSFRFVFKFQFIDLDTFIRRDFSGNYEIPLIKRFEETRLSQHDFSEILASCRHYGFETMVTPFDEPSVDNIVSQSVDFIKIASCSFGDWPLLEKIVTANMPVVASCAGASLDTIDRVICFFRNRNIPLVLQHCIGEYPTLDIDMNITNLSCVINILIFLSVCLARTPLSLILLLLLCVFGAVSFEMLLLKLILSRRISIQRHHLSFLNGLPPFIELTKLWKYLFHYDSSSKEQLSLQNLRRGVFASTPIPKGSSITDDCSYLAFPPSDGQLTANDLSKYVLLRTTRDINPGEPILLSDLLLEDRRHKLEEIAIRVSRLIATVGVVVPDHADLEISHHYGLDKFYNFGMTMLTIINREYCKKILILLPKQQHPEQFHKLKEETFIVVWGSGIVRLDGNDVHVKSGSVVTIEPGVKHEILSHDGLIIEEISTSHISDDSYYSDPSILGSDSRKSFLKHWRIHQ